VRYTHLQGFLTSTFRAAQYGLMLRYRCTM